MRFRANGPVHTSQGDALGLWSELPQALKGRAIILGFGSPIQGFDVCVGWFPRALPWAGMERPLWLGKGRRSN
jgi:hypothetical protein